MSETPLNFMSLSQWLGLPMDEVGSVVRQAFAALKVAEVCIVQSFDPGDGVSTPPTVTVLPAVMEKIYQNTDGVMLPKDFKWNNPFRCTVEIAGAGNFVQTFPIQKGDECFVIFNNVALDSWRQSGGENNVQLPALRRHNYADGVATFRPHSAAVPIPNYNTSAAELRTLDGSIKLTLSASGITITGNVTIANGSHLYIVTPLGTIDLNTHGHSAVIPGSGESGPPVA